VSDLEALEPEAPETPEPTEVSAPDAAQPLRDVMAAAAEGVERRDVEAENAARELIGSGTVDGDRLGRLAEWGVWLSGVQSTYPPRPLDRVHVLVVGTQPGPDHDVHRLAALNGVRLTSVVLQVDSTCVEAAEAGLQAVDAAVDAGCDLLVATALVDEAVSATLVAILLRLSATEVVGDSPHLDDAAWAELVGDIRDRTHAARASEDHEVAVLHAVGSPELAALAAIYLRAAARHTPVLLDGSADAAAALCASRTSLLASWWWFGASSSSNPSTTRAVEALGLEPLLRLDGLLDGGAAALAALPRLRSAQAVLAGD
jgi:nicotinate-nucleotide--dimethylbenzimidazole phosphoribosyltransferase